MDVVPIKLVPIDHLLGTFDALGSIIFTPYGWLGGSDRRNGSGSSDFTSEALMVDVRLAATRIKSTLLAGVEES